MNTIRTTTLQLIPLILLVSAGCPQPIEVAQVDLLPDAAVAPYILEPSCQYEPIEVGKIPHISGDLLARLVRTDDGAVVIRHQKGSENEPAKISLESIRLKGSLTKIAVTNETGEAGPVIGLDAVVGGGNVVVALTRPQGRVDVLTLAFDGETQSPLQTLRTEKVGIADVIWHDRSSLIFIDGALMRPDGSLPQLVEIPEPEDEADGGPAEAGVDPLDSGPTEASGTDPSPSIKALEIPSGIRSVVSAGETLGWIRSEGQEQFLEHVIRDQGRVLSQPVAPSRPNDDVRLIWTGDRYLLGSSAGADMARFVVARPRARSKSRDLYFELGGRMHLPRPPRGVIWTAWNNAGARHVGLAQLLEPKLLRFVNAALRGTILDAAIHIRREHDIVAADVVWDGSAYALIWAERLDDNMDQLIGTRFSCPDDR